MGPLAGKIGDQYGAQSKIFLGAAVLFTATILVLRAPSPATI